MTQCKVIQIDLKFFPITAHTAEIKDYYETNFGKCLKVEKIQNLLTKKYEGYVRVDIEEPSDLNELLEAISVTPFQDKTIKASIFVKPPRPPRPPMIFELPDNPFPFDVVLNSPKRVPNKSEDEKKRKREKEAQKDRDDEKSRRRRDHDDDSDRSPPRRRRERDDFDDDFDRSPSRHRRDSIDRSPHDRKRRDRSPHERRERSPYDRRDSRDRSPSRRERSYERRERSPRDRRD